MIRYDVAGRAFDDFNKTHTTQYGAIIGITLILMLCLYGAFVKFQPHPISGEDPEYYRIACFYVASFAFFAICRIFYDLYFEIPYLYFTEDMFYLDEGTKKVGGYWRDVVEIGSIAPEKESPLGDLPDKAVYFVLGGGQLFVINPKIVNLRGEDVAATSKIFWERALARISA